jgi:VIT1/CCC1 family predicted Fe2+/Mn2+ transporter
MSLIIITPLWLAQLGFVLPLGPFESAICVAFGLIFLLGVFLGHVSGKFWLFSGIQALIIALITTFLIYVIA